MRHAQVEHCSVQVFVNAPDYTDLHINMEVLANIFLPLIS